ncbi:MAG: EamA family transporter [Elusimicrobia bacterium]|nr:EamA family transporter [Elusimicrobiota bacterium]
MKYFYALLSAFFFSISVPLAKLMLDQTSPLQLAALMYLGAGIGLSLYLCALNFGVKKNNISKEAPLEKKDIPFVIGFIISGGIIAPILLFKGLTFVSASMAALALNFELIFTALIAFFFFKEHGSIKLLLSVIFVILGACILLFDFQKFLFSFNWGIVLAIGASFMWALDNNFTAKISIKNPIAIAAIKGIAGGLANLIFAFYVLGFNLNFKLILAGLSLGFISYGISIVLLIRSMRELGASRAGIFFGTNPFMAALLSIIILKEAFTYQFVFSAIIMAIGILFIFSEKHKHKHYHEYLEHSHGHTHDGHHKHEHGGENKSFDIHSHKHIHNQTNHFHEHLPDAHHKHKH